MEGVIAFLLPVYQARPDACVMWFFVNIEAHVTALHLLYGMASSQRWEIGQTKIFQTISAQIFWHLVQVGDRHVSHFQMRGSYVFMLISLVFVSAVTAEPDSDPGESAHGDR